MFAPDSHCGLCSNKKPSELASEPMSHLKLAPGDTMTVPGATKATLAAKPTYQVRHITSMTLWVMMAESHQRSLWRWQALARLRRARR